MSLSTLSVRLPARSSGKWLGHLFIPAAALWLAWVLWAGLMDPPELPMLPGPVNGQSDTGAQFRDYGHLATLHLFGEAELKAVKQVAARPKPPAPPPRPRRQMTLSGLLSENGEGVAFIAVDAGKAAAYRVGEELPGGGELREIQADHVVIGDGEASETLMLERPRMGSANSRIAASPSSVSSTRRRPPRRALGPMNPGNEEF